MSVVARTTTSAKQSRSFFSWFIVSVIQRVLGRIREPGKDALESNYADESETFPCDTLVVCPSAMPQNVKRYARNVIRPPLGFCSSGPSAAAHRDFSIDRNYHECVGVGTSNWTRSGNKVALAVVGL
jgi:hypothetical protein